MLVCVLNLGLCCLMTIRIPMIHIVQTSRCIFESYSAQMFARTIQHSCNLCRTSIWGHRSKKNIYFQNCSPRLLYLADWLHMVFHLGSSNHFRNYTATNRALPQSSSTAEYCFSIYSAKISAIIWILSYMIVLLSSICWLAVNTVDLQLTYLIIFISGYYIFPSFFNDRNVLRNQPDQQRWRYMWCGSGFFVNHQVDHLGSSVLRTQRVKAKFDASNLNDSNFLHWLMSALNEAFCKTRALVAENLEIRPHNSSFTSIFRAVEDKALRHFDTQQMRQILKTALGLYRLLKMTSAWATYLTMSSFTRISFYLHQR